MKISELKPLEKNPFRPGDGSIERIAKSIEDFQKMISIRKIVIDENNEIIGGNKRFFALKSLGYKEIPDNWIDKRTDLTPEEKKRFIITDNAHFGSDWDFEMLQEWDVPDQEWGVETEEMPDAIEGDFENSQNPNDVYGGNSTPVRIASLLAYITDKQIQERINGIMDKINKVKGDGEQAQKEKNKIGEYICEIIIDNENSILDK